MESKEYFKVTTYIKEQIKSGKLQLGGKLETERKLAENLGISRPSAREALKSMENMGLIESRQGSGNYLTGNLSKNLSESFGLMLLMKQVDYKAITEVRRAIELEAYKIAMERVTKEQLQELRGYLEAPINGSVEEKITLDQKFHFTLIKATGNALMMSIVAPLDSICQEAIREVYRKITLEEKIKLETLHKEIYMGLEKKDLERGTLAIKAHYELANQLEDRD